MMEWEDMITLIKILDNYDVNYQFGAYYDEEGKITGHWLEINAFIDSEEI